MMRYILLGFISINLMLCGISNTGLNLNQAQAFITLNQEIKSVSIDELEYFLSESPSGRIDNWTPLLISRSL